MILISQKRKPTNIQPQNPSALFVWIVVAWFMMGIGFVIVFGAGRKCSNLKCQRGKTSMSCAADRRFSCSKFSKDILPSRIILNQTIKDQIINTAFSVLSRCLFSFRNRGLFDLLQKAFRIGSEEREHGWSMSLTVVAQGCKGRIKVKVCNVPWWKRDYVISAKTALS